MHMYMQINVHVISISKLQIKPIKGKLSKSEVTLWSHARHMNSTCYAYKHMHLKKLIQLH